MGCIIGDVEGEGDSLSVEAEEDREEEKAARGFLPCCSSPSSSMTMAAEA